MASYHVYVRDYHWSHRNLVVQSPILNLDSPSATLIFRLLEGDNRNEPRVGDSVTEFTDDVHGDVYRTEAHGVIVSTEGQQNIQAPIWVPVSSHCMNNEISVVNLATFEASTVPITQICWVPGREGPNQNLYTVIGAPRKTLGKTLVVAVVHPVGDPGSTRFTLLSPSELTGYDVIGDARKKSLFDIQLRAIQGKTKPPSRALRDIYRLYSSPYRIGKGRRTLDEIMDEDLEVPGSGLANFDGSSRGSSFSDGDEAYDRPVHDSMVVASNRPYDCGCTYSGLGPTHVTPRPPHRHGTDDDCSLGANHQHCVFADREPSICVVPTAEPHACCVHPMQAMLSDYERDNGMADGDELQEHKEGESVGGGQYFESADSMDMDVEPTFVAFVEEPSPQLQPDTQAVVFDRYSVARDMTPFPLLLDTHADVDVASSGMHDGLMLNPHVNFESCLSPEPPDLQF
ncbi:hypothetical protein GGR53DRAFT_189993 [Hypoxylon sp. FL1150]|nr:hypothetical protein GGR53DRAFT_189993 [Hypoxylon sp. FL1150]